MTPEAEKFNGWAAMLGFVAAFGAYATTGQIIPGIFQLKTYIQGLLYFASLIFDLIAFILHFVHGIKFYLFCFTFSGKMSKRY